MTNFEKMWEDEIKEREQYDKELGEDLGYLATECINCGRARVIKYSSGRKICEKCCFDQDKKEYDHKYREYWG